MPRWLDRLKGKKARDVPGVAESAAMVPSSLAAEENVAVAKPAEEHASKDPTVFDVKSAERAFDETDDGKRLDAENFSAMVPYERDKARTVYAQKRAKFYHGLMSDEQRAYTRGLCQDILRENDNRVTNIGIVPGPLLLHAGHIADKESMRDAPIYLTTNPDIIGNNDGVNGYISSSPDRVMAAFL